VPDVTGAITALTDTPFPACTAACTSRAENDNADTPGGDHRGESDGVDIEPIDQGDPLEKIAAAIAGLSAEDRVRLARMFE
jgi:hypothetical protein